MGGIQDGVAHCGGTARETDILVRFGMGVMRFATGQMTVIMVLMHDHNRGRAIDHRPIFLASFVNHPVVPTRAADGEFGNVSVARFWEQEEVASGGTVEGALTIDD